MPTKVTSQQQRKGQVKDNFMFIVNALPIYQALVSESLDPVLAISDHSVCSANNRSSSIFSPPLWLDPHQSPPHSHLLQAHY